MSVLNCAILRHHEYELHVSLKLMILFYTYDCVQDEESLQQRTEYLKQQRDKLHALKRDQTLKTPTERAPVAPDPRHHTQVLAFIHSVSTDS